ncbi:hypothetical protein B9Q03_09685 [Candidatus Marsarchaeota G2 archaeon OSP_D]|jgi:hypothetical protein|uniref:Uncharacterized protein n=2 Tax=Candidatus Marsarchaeota TaxID=1978152 RepID=A0A2R6AKQ5_9ARCH|nr:MAG: hypothetical protein B9Q00_10150 [Candidatus Marsarchaeota G1 archaeon OSP_C]PSN88073.1 MAG: hypothetical protein B9Q03_09685 [Candidatus Marsarchaeota G2 archaeon OSP_D]
MLAQVVEQAFAQGFLGTMEAVVARLLRPKNNRASLEVEIRRGEDSFFFAAEGRSLKELNDVLKEDLVLFLKEGGNVEVRVIDEKLEMLRN